MPRTGAPVPCPNACTAAWQSRLVHCGAPLGAWAVTCQGHQSSEEADHLANGLLGAMSLILSHKRLSLKPGNEADLFAPV